MRWLHIPILIFQEINFGVIDCQRQSLLNAVHETLSSVYLPAISRSDLWEQQVERKSNNKSKFISSLNSFVNVIYSAQESIDDIVKLEPCNTVDLSSLTTPSLYAAAASVTETLEAIEVHARIWIKQIEQVSKRLA